MTALLAAVCHFVFEVTIWPETITQWLAIVALGIGPVGIAFFTWDIGMKRGDIKLGDKLIVDGYAAKDGSHLLDARRIYFNGKAILGGSEGDGGPGGQ